MNKQTRKYLVLLGAGLLVVSLFVALGGLSQNIDLFLKDENGNAISGATCQLDNPPGCSSGLANCRKVVTSSSAGRCSFTGLVGGENYWGSASCTKPLLAGQSIVERWSLSVLASETYTFTTNKYITLSGCRSSNYNPLQTTTTTIQTCEGATVNKCYNGDLWKYDACGNRLTRVEACGQYGCRNSACYSPVSTTSPPTTLKVTTTTLKVTTTSNGPTTTTIPKPGDNQLMIGLVAVAATVGLLYVFMKK